MICLIQMTRAKGLLCDGQLWAVNVIRNGSGAPVEDIVKRTFDISHAGLE